MLRKTLLISRGVYKTVCQSIQLIKMQNFNPSPSSGESDANLTNTRRNGDRQAGRGYRSKAAKTALSPFI
jgi:hypothetical protein